MRTLKGCPRSPDLASGSSPNALWVHYIDNGAALATLIKGSSSVLSGEVITAYTHGRVAAMGLWPWFDRVASSDNPVDQLSRGKMEGPRKLLEIEFPPILVRDLQTNLRKTEKRGVVNSP